MTMTLVGTGLLWFGWFGFNAASTFAATDVRFAIVALNTAIAAAFSGGGHARAAGATISLPLAAASEAVLRIVAELRAANPRR